MKRRKLIGFLLAFVLLLSSILPSGNGLVKAQDIDTSSQEINSEKVETSVSKEKKTENKKSKKNLKEKKDFKNLKKQEEKIDPQINKSAKVNAPNDGKLSNESKNLLQKEPGETTNYSSSIMFPPQIDPDKAAFYGGETINLYNQVSLSGNTTILAPGSYTKIYLPKDKFTKPNDYDINTDFASFKDLQITETDDDYVIKTSFQRLAGGYNGATPFNVSLLARETPNNSVSRIRQEFYDANDKKLSESYLDVKGKAEIEDPGNYDYDRNNLEDDVNENHIVNKGTNYTFPYDSLFPPTYDYNDPRDRRVTVEIPEGLRLVDPDHQWTYDEKSGTYYKDIKRSQVDADHLTATVDLGGLDLSDYDDYFIEKPIQLSYSISVVKDGVVQTDISPNSWTSTRYFYAPSNAPSPDPDPDPDPDPPTPPPEEPADHRFATYRKESLIDRNYKVLQTSGYYPRELYVYLPYEDSLLANFRMKFSHQAIDDFYFYNSKDKNDPELTISCTYTEVTPCTYPSELRINLDTKGLTAQEVKKFANKLKGTKAYGVKYDGSNDLLTSRVPIAYDGKGSYFKFEGSDYKEIEFEYPNDGLTLEGMTEINKFKNALWTDVISDFRPETVQTLKAMLDNNSVPKLDYNDNVKGLSDYNDESETYYDVRYKEYSKDKERIHTGGITYFYTHTYKYLDYNDINRQNSVTLSNGSFFYPGDVVKTYLSYIHARNGDNFPAVDPVNANLYYLVPDGLEPIEDPDEFSQMRVVRGYQEGYNLVIAKPKVTEIPSGSGLVSSQQNNYRLNFKVTSRLDVGDYKIYAALVIDNNKIGVENHKQYGIMQYDTPSGKWEGITTKLDNRSEKANSFTDLESCSFSVFPPLVLSSYKEVKLRTDPDSSYASALGERAHIGDEIDYRWYFKNNTTSAIKNLMVIDVLPYNGDHAIVENLEKKYPSRGSKFRTPLQSVEANKKFDFYYSTDPVRDTLEENKDASWHESVADPSKVTMIKAVLKPGQKIGVKEVCTIVTHNQIENNASIKDGDKAYNSFAYSLNDGNTFTEALKTEVAINYPKKDVLVKKVDRKDESKPIANVSFDLYSSDGKLLKEGLLTKPNGELLLRNLLVGKSYYLLEKSAPDPYVVNDQKISFTVSDQQDQQVLLVKNGTDKIDIPVTKLWEDQDNKEAKRPESIKVKLLADGIETDKELTLNEKNHWTGSFTDLAKYNISGEETNYSVKEVGEVDHSAHIDGIWYKVEVTGTMEDGFTITNKKQNPVTPPVPKKRNIEVEKKWKDSKGKPMSAPVKSIQVELYENGKATGKKKILKASNNWKASFKDLATAKKSNGALIDYTVKEVGANNNQIELSGDSYKVSMTGNLKEGFTITNQLQDIPNKPKNPTPPTPPEKPNLPEKPDFPHKTRIPERKPKEYKAIHKIVPKVIEQPQAGNPNTGAASFSLVPLVGFASLLFMIRKKGNK